MLFEMGNTGLLLETPCAQYPDQHLLSIASYSYTPPLPPLPAGQLLGRAHREAAQKGQARRRPAGPVVEAAAERVAHQPHRPRPGRHAHLLQPAGARGRALHGGLVRRRARQRDVCAAGGRREHRPSQVVPAGACACAWGGGACCIATPHVHAGEHGCGWCTCLHPACRDQRSSHMAH